MSLTLAFTKGAGRMDRLVVTHPDGRQEAIDAPKQRIVPHDMVHFAIESVLDARGFLGRVAEGEAADFTMSAEAESDGVERLVEVFQGDGWSGGQTLPAEMIALYRVTCDARGCPPLAIDETAIIAIRARLAELTAAWEAVKVGETLTLRFDG